MRLAWLVALAVGSGCAAHRFECTAHGGGQVLHLQSEHFDVTSELPEKELRLEVTRLERLRDSFALFLGVELRPSARIPVVVMALGAPAEFVEGAGGWVAGDVSPMLVTSAAFWDSNTGSSSTSSTPHELSHLLVRGSIPRLPRWLDEGLAEYVGDARFRSQDVVRFGRWVWTGEHHVASLETMWGWRGDIAPDKALGLYQSAWAWVHYLANRDEQRLSRLWAELRARPSPEEAFTAVFPRTEWEPLRVKVEAYVAEGRYSGWESRSLVAPRLGAARVLAPWEVHLLRRRIARTLGDRAVAKAEGAVALAVGPTPTPGEVLVARAVDTLIGPALSDALAPWAKDVGALEAAQVTDLAPADAWARLSALAAGDAAPPLAVLRLAQWAVRLRRPDAPAFAERAITFAPTSLVARVNLVSALSIAKQCEPAAHALAEAQGLESAGRHIDLLDNAEQAVKSCREQQ